MGDALAKFTRALFDAVLEEQIMLERASQQKVTVDEKDVDRAIEGLRRQNNLEDDAAFEEALKQAGLTEETLRKRYRQSMLLQRVAQGEVGKIEITTAEVREEYEKEKERFKTPPKVELRQLFFPVSDDGKDREAVLQRARGLVARVRAGGDLQAEATLAGVELTDLGAIPVKDLRAELRDALDGLEEGAITGPLETAGGFQVLQLVRRVPEGYRPFEKVEDMLRRKLAQERYQKQTRGLVEKLKKEYLVEVHPELLDLIVPGAGKKAS
jgi:parvulin-like peptidyl-prolyl isomerase